MRSLVAMFVMSLFVWGCQEQSGQRVVADRMPEGVQRAETIPGDKPMLPAYKLPHEKFPNKADSFGDYKDSHPEWYGISNPPSVGVRPIAEYEPGQQKLLITYSSTGLPSGIKKNLADIVKYGKQVVEVVIIYPSNSHKTNFTSLLGQYGVSTSGLTWKQMDLDSIWVRDFGPVSLVSDSNKTAFADFRYYHQRIYDDAVPAKTATQWNVTDYRTPVDFEGGNFMSDAKGNCFASEGLLWYNGAGESAIKGYMKDYVGCANTYITKALDGEGTTHIDMAAKLISDDMVVVGEYTQNQDAANYQICNQNAALFESLGYEAVRMPMPSNSDGNFRTYINSLFVNGINMVPVYSIDKTKEAQAMQIWEQMMPEWQHVAMNSDDVIQWAGAIHCITMTVGPGSLSKVEADPGYACNGDWSCYPGNTGDGCDGVTFEGCCDGQLLKYCENGQLQQVNCGNQPSCGWDAGNKFYNCGTAGGEDPSGQNPKDCGGGPCEPDCAGKACGSDGCGGVCGQCGNNETCQSGQCVPGGDTCGGVTFEGCCDGELLKYCENGQLQTLDCAGNASCGWNAQANYYDCGTNGAADPSGQNPKDCGGGPCVPACAGKECGADGCGGECGQCGNNETCQNGQCVPAGAGCDGLTYEGCCDGQVLQWCENGKVETINCAQNPSCGWDAQANFYNCGTNGAGEPSGQFPLECGGGCEPQCANKECGTDGCGGSCGSCPGGWSCSNGKCVNNCVPNCTGKLCGDDGCGGTCGQCAAGEACQAGKCVGQADPCMGISWEGCCEGTVLHYCENGQLISGDCGDSGCGWNGDQKYYDCQQAGADPSGANPLECPGQGCIPNCGSKECGDDGCGGSCGVCGDGLYCYQGLCQPENACGDVDYKGECDGTKLTWCQNGKLMNFDCQNLGGTYVCGWESDTVGNNCIDQSGCQPVCEGKECGQDGCGGTCGKCQAGLSCQAGLCVEGPCESDCAGAECGDDGCGGLCGTCPPGWFCEGGHCNTICQPNCAGKECGSDGCAGSCGQCPAGMSCTAGLCQEGPCEPDCTGKECGDDGCEGSCGSCGDAESCVAGKCEGVCQPDCAGKECGGDGCGDSCGVCPPGQSCKNGLCEQGCQPDCAGKECGDDGCGGLCGACPAGQVCDAGQCELDCVANCTGKECGPDGCGGMCGTCPKDFSCDDGSCVPDAAGCGNVTSAGECDGDLLKKCVSSQIVTIDCSETGKLCSFVPANGVYDCVEQCVPNCAGKACGQDGCGGTCGGCQKGFDCMTGQCIEKEPPCVADCTGLVCGDDGCGGSCGACPEGTSCQTGACVEDDPDPDLCPEGQTMEDGLCVEITIDDLPKGGSGGCAVEPTGAPAGGALLLVLALMAALMTGARVLAGRRSRD